MPPEQYAETLIPLALRLAAAVRDEGPDTINGILAAAHALPAPPNINPTIALAVILAAAVDPTRTREELLGWTRTFGGPLETAPIPTGPAANALAVEMAIAGHLPIHALSPDEQARTVDTLVDRKWSFEAIAAHLDTDKDTIRRIRWRSTHRRRQARKAAA